MIQTVTRTPKKQYFVCIVVLLSHLIVKLLKLVQVMHGSSSIKIPHFCLRHYKIN